MFDIFSFGVVYFGIFLSAFFFRSFLFQSYLYIPHIVTVSFFLPYLGFIYQLEFFCSTHTKEDTGSTHVSRSSLTISHTMDEKKATTGQFIGCFTEINHEDNMGWYTYVLFIMTQNSWNIVKKH